MKCLFEPCRDEEESDEYEEGSSEESSGEDEEEESYIPESTPEPPPSPSPPPLPVIPPKRTIEEVVPEKSEEELKRISEYKRRKEEIEIDILKIQRQVALLQKKKIEIEISQLEEDEPPETKPVAVFDVCLKPEEEQ